MIKKAALNLGKISAGNTALATITRIEMFLPVVCSFSSFGGPESRELYFLIVYITLRQIDTTSDVFPQLFRLHANNWKKTAAPPVMRGYFFD